MATSPGPASQTARALAREQLTATILATARAQLATVGPDQLSLRAVAREVGMVSSAVYRYFPSRDELLTELLIVCFDEVGERVEEAERRVDRRDLPGRWLAVAHAFHDWARSHPYDYALLFGSPVPGYVAPERTIAPATRVPRVVMGLLRDQPAPDAGSGGPTDAGSAPLHRALAGIRDFAGADLPDDLVLAGLQAWSGLIGGVTLELFGHLVNAVDDYDTYFDAAARRLCPVGTRPV